MNRVGQVWRFSDGDTFVVLEEPDLAQNDSDGSARHLVLWLDVPSENDTDLTAGCSTRVRESVYYTWERDRDLTRLL